MPVDSQQCFVGGRKQNLRERETKQYTTETSIKPIASISSSQVGGLAAKPSASGG